MSTMKVRTFRALSCTWICALAVGCGSESSSGSGSGGAGGAGGTAGSAGADGQAGDTGADAAIPDGDSDGAVCNLPAPIGACTSNDMYCTSKSKACPGDRYDCKNGVWVKADLDAACQMLGHDFAYGCVLDESVGGILLACGNACDPADGGCD